MLEVLQGYGWALQVLLVVLATLLLRYLAVRLLENLARHLHHNTIHWDDAVLKAGRPALTWLIRLISTMETGKLASLPGKAPEDGHLDITIVDGLEPMLQPFKAEQGTGDV